MTSRTSIYFATHNPNKKRELLEIISSKKELFEGNFELKLASDLGREVSWIEDGVSFFDNALIKAKAVKALTQDVVLAEDSGLMVDFLDGAPGIYSSRYAGNDLANNEKLLQALNGIPPAKRGAQYVCCLVYVDGQNQVRSFEDIVRGKIADSPRGSYGFGYDPIFIPDELNEHLPEKSVRTMAQLSPNEKNGISHRGKAVSRWLQYLLTSQGL